MSLGPRNPDKIITITGPNSAVDTGISFKNVGDVIYTKIVTNIVQDTDQFNYNFTTGNYATALYGGTGIASKTGCFVCRPRIPGYSLQTGGGVCRIPFENTSPSQSNSADAPGELNVTLKISMSILSVTFPSVVHIWYQPCPTK